MLDEWSQQEMEMFSRCLIETNKDFSLVAKQVYFCLILYLLCRICDPFLDYL